MDIDSEIAALEVAMRYESDQEQIDRILDEINALKTAKIYIP
jgi:hypothetical protein